MALPVSIGLTAVGLRILSKYIPPDDIAPGQSLANIFTGAQQEIHQQTQETQQSLINMKTNELNKIQTKLTQQINNIQENTSRLIKSTADKTEAQKIKASASLEIQKLKENALRNATRAAALIGSTEEQVIKNASKVLNIKSNDIPTKPLVSNANRYVITNNTNKSKPSEYPNFDISNTRGYGTIVNQAYGKPNNTLLASSGTSTIVSNTSGSKKPENTGTSTVVSNTNGSKKLNSSGTSTVVSNTNGSKKLNSSGTSTVVSNTSGSKKPENTGTSTVVSNTNGSKKPENSGTSTVVSNTNGSKKPENSGTSTFVSNTNGSKKPDGAFNTNQKSYNTLSGKVADTTISSYNNDTKTQVIHKDTTNVMNTNSGETNINTKVESTVNKDNNNRTANSQNDYINNAVNNSNVNKNASKLVEKAYQGLEMNSLNNISDEEMVQNAYQRAKEIIQQAEKNVQKKLDEAEKNIKSLETDAKLQASIIIKKAEENAATVLAKLRSPSNSNSRNTSRGNVISNATKQMREQAEKEAKKIIETAQANATKIRAEAQNAAQSNSRISAEKMNKARKMIEDAEMKASQIMKNVNQSQTSLQQQFSELSRKEKDLQQKLLEIQRLEENKIKESIQKAVNSASQGNMNSTKNALRNATKVVNAALSETEQIRQNMRDQSRLLAQSSQNALQKQANEQFQRIGEATVEQATASAQAKSILDKANLEAQRIIAEAKVLAGKANKANANTAYDIIANANRKASEIQAKAQQEANKTIRSAQNVVKGLSNSSTQDCSLYSLNSKINPEITPPSFNNQLDKEYIDQLQTRFNNVVSLVQSNDESITKHDNLSSMFSDYNNTFIPSPEFDTEIYNDRTILDHVHSLLLKLHQDITRQQVNTSTNTSIMGTVQDIVKLYIDIVRKLLSTPIMYKLTGLDADSMKALIASSSIQLYNDKYKPINKALFMEKLYKFLYIDLTPYLLIRQSSLLNPYYSNYTKQLEDYIIQDTENSSFVLYPKSGAMNKRSIFILRFIDMISNTYNKNDRNTKSFNYHILTYIITVLPDLYNFVSNLHNHIENPENDAFAMSINMLLFRKLRQNVLTYIKIRNDDGAVYNDRFKVFVDSEKNNTLLVRYNDHNIPYYSYDSSQKSWNASPTVKQDWNALYGVPSYNEVFEVNSGMLSVKGYSDEYLLGPFTRVFDQQLNNRGIADKMDEVLIALKKENTNPKPVFLIGYGASGAGKTSSLVYFNKGVDIDSQNGILMHLCNRLNEAGGYNNIRVKSIEFYAKEGSGQPVKRISPVGKPYLKFHYTSEKGFVLSDTYNHKNAFKARVMQQLRGNNIDDFKETQFPTGTVLGEVMIHMIDNDRFVKATTNNPNSSRSHCLIFINFGDEKPSNNNNEIDFDPKRTLIVGDFAGVENLFNCMDDKQLQGFIGVKKDDGSGKPFYSETDLSLSGQEGGHRLKRVMKRQLGGTDDPCVLAIQDTSDVFKLGVSPRTLQTNDESLELVIKELYGDYKFYNAFLKSIYDQIVKSSQLESNNAFETLLNTPIDKVEKYFDEYETNNIETLVNTGNIFINVFQKFAELNENNDDSQNAYEKLLSHIAIEVDTSDITCNFKTQTEVPTGKDTINAYEHLSNAISGLKITPAPFLKDARNCIMTHGQTTFLSYATATKIFDNSFCPSNYGATSKDEYAKNLLWSTDNAEQILDSMRKGLPSQLTKNNGETLYLSSFFINKKIPMKCAKISNRRFVSQIVSVLDHPLFSMIGIDVSDNVIRFKDIGKQFRDQYVRYKLGPFVSAVSNGQLDLRQFFKHLINEAKSIVVNTSCRVKHSTKVCSVRRAEGVFINNSLYGIREVIKEIMYEKNKNSMNIAPLFHEPCLPTYCSKDNRDCFKLTKPKKSIANQIFEALIEELNPQLRGIAPEKIPKGETLKDLIVGVFCVLNLSRKANNPPPVPYINTNHIRFELSKSSQINPNIINECRKLLNKLQFFLHKNAKVRIELNPGWLSNLKLLIDNENMVIEKGITSEQESALYNLLNALDNISAASAMGTLQFVDMMSKYNTTDMICSQQKLSDNGNLYKELIRKLDLIDIVNKKDKYNTNSNQLGDHKVVIESVPTPEPEKPVVNSKTGNANDKRVDKTVSTARQIPPRIISSKPAVSKPTIKGRR